MSSGWRDVVELYVISWAHDDKILETSPIWIFTHRLLLSYCMATDCSINKRGFEFITRSRCRLQTAAGSYYTASHVTTVGRRPLVLGTVDEITDDHIRRIFCTSLDTLYIFRSLWRIDRLRWRSLVLAAVFTTSTTSTIDRSRARPYWGCCVEVVVWRMKLVVRWWWEKMFILCI
jgi:hypothetical protein